MSRALDAPAATSAVRGTRVNPLRVAAAVAMLGVSVIVLSVAMSRSESVNRDYSVYWAGGQQLVHHGNPYDAATVLRVLHAAGSTSNKDSIARNPPYALFLMVPLGLVSSRVGAVLWSLGLVTALMASIRMLWVMQGRPPDRLHLVGYVFPPVLACLLAGQLGAVLLLGVTLFLYFHASRPALAGAALLLCALKPHLFFPFGVVLLMWIVRRRQYRILAGACFALFASLVLSFALDPAIWSQYAQGERGENIQNLFIPCLSLVFRVLVHRDAVWLQFVPEVVGCAWGIWFFMTRRHRWNWIEQGSVLLLVSVLVAPYAWFTDETVVLPAIFAGLYRASNAGRSLLPFGCVAGVALLEVLAGVPLTTGYYLWTAPAWLAWYLLAVRGTDQVVAGDSAGIAAVRAAGE